MAEIQPQQQQQQQGEKGQASRKVVSFNTGHEPGSSSPLLDESKPGRRRFISRSKRSRTDLNNVPVESRAFRHAQIFRRPRALQYTRLEGSDQLGPTPTRTSTRSSTDSGNEDDESDAEERSTDDLPKQRGRLDLFVDLIWVGIIANLSGNFGEQAYTESGVSMGLAVVEFCILFIMIWRVWDNLRSYTSHYYVDDILQRNFTLWILLLAVLYGINAPFAFNPDGEGDSSTLLIVVYLITKVSFLAANLLQAVFIPLLLRAWYFQLGFTVATAGLWIGAIYADYPTKLILLIIANTIEHPVTVFLASPTADRLLTKGLERATDVDHYMERHEGFFIIILGEGVFRLIDGSPSGLGINTKTGTVLTALLLYYLLHWLYFNGDQSKEFVHALRRTWWKPVLWQFLHVLMFGALLFLDSSVLYLCQHSKEISIQTVSAREATPSETESPEATRFFTLNAVWVASISLAATLSCMTGIALLNRSLDHPMTLVINSRLIRIAPRLPAVIFIICLPLIPNLSGGTWCGAAIATLYAVFLWEWLAGLEKEWTVFEPKDSKL